MRTGIAAILVLSSAFLANAAHQQDELQAELKKLEGTWEGYTVEGRGERPDRGPVHLRLTITPTKMSAINLGDNNKNLGSGTYKLNLTNKTKEMDATGLVLPGKREKTYQGIYELHGEMLKWCVSPRQGERPSEFRTGGGSFLLILKRKG